VESIFAARTAPGEWSNVIPVWKKAKKYSVVALNAGRDLNTEYHTQRKLVAAASIRVVKTAIQVRLMTFVHSIAAVEDKATRQQINTR